MKKQHFGTIAKPANTLFCIIHYVVPLEKQKGVISQYECSILVITRVRAKENELPNECFLV